MKETFQRESVSSEGDFDRLWIFRGYGEGVGEVKQREEGKGHTSIVMGCSHSAKL